MHKMGSLTTRIVHVAEVLALRFRLTLEEWMWPSDFGSASTTAVAPKFQIPACLELVYTPRLKVDGSI